MLRFQEPLTPAAKFLVGYSLEAAADDLLDLYDDEGWRASFARSATCFTRELARTVALDLREKLDRPEEYDLTDYHWLLLYDVLQVYVDVINDFQLRDVITALQPLATAEDAGYLQLQRRAQRRTRIHLEFDWFINKFFWDTDFLLEPELFVGLGPEAKCQLGTNPSSLAWSSDCHHIRRN